MLHTRSASIMQNLNHSSGQVPRAPFSRPRHAQHSRPTVTVTSPNVFSPAPITALPAGVAQAGHHVCRAAQEAGSATDDDGKVFTLPAATVSAAEAFAAAAAAAEAAQQQLMIKGSLADEMQHNQLLRRVMEAYSTLQRLYHKALLPLIQRHDPVAATVAGLTYALFTEKQKVTFPGTSATVTAQWAKLKAVGDQIHLDELVELDTNCKPPTDPFEAPLYNVPHHLLSALVMKGRGAAKPSDCLVLGDAVTVISQGFAKEVTDTGEWHNLLKRETVQLMLAAFQPSTRVPDLGSDRALGLQMELEDLLSRTMLVAVHLGASIQSALLMRRLRDSVLDTLSSEADRSAVLMALKEFNTWDAAPHSNPFKTTLTKRFSLATLIVWLARCCLHRALAGMLYHTTLQQLLGATSMTDWQWVEKVLTVLAVSTDSEAEVSWARGELKLLSTLQQTVEGVHNAAQMIDSVDMVQTAATLGGLPAAAAHLTSMELLQSASLAVTKSSRQMERFMSHYNFTGFAARALDCYLNLELRNLPDVIDSEGGCWPFLFYYLDIRQLALQLSSGKTGPAAVESAHMLMSEKHSVFVARLALRIYSPLSPSFASRSHAISFLSTAPLQWDADLRNTIIARGNPKTAATLAAHYPHVPNQVHTSATCTCSATAATTMQKWFATLLQQTEPSGVTPKQFLLKALSAVDSPQSAPPELSAAFELLLQEHLTLRVAVDGTEAAGHNTSDKGAQYAWFTAALAQYRVLQQASSPEVARLLLATENPGEEYIRPIHEFVAIKKAQAGLLVDAICDLAWSLPSSTAAALASNKEPIMIAPPTSNKLSSILWVAAAAPTTPLHGTVHDRKVLNTVTADMAAMLEAAHGRPLINFDEYILFRLAYEYASYGVCDKACLLLLNILDGRPFKELQPATQAAMLGALRLVLAQMIAQGTPVPQVVQQLLQIVPLTDSRDLLPLAKHAALHGPCEANSVVWKAAVRAALDPTVNQLPVFGHDRLDDEHLAESLSAFAERGCLGGSVAEALIPVFQELTCHIQQQEPTMVGDAAADDNSRQPPTSSDKHAVLAAGHKAVQTAAGSANPPHKRLGLVLLEVVCGVLELERVRPAGQQQLIQGVLLPLLKVCHQYAPLPEGLYLDVGAVAATEIIETGTMVVLDEILDTWQQLQLQPSQLTHILNGVVQIAAVHTSKAPAAKQVFMRVWSKALPMWETIGTMGETVGITPYCAAEVLTAMQRSDAVADHLLQDKWPLQVLCGLIESALDHRDTVREVPTLLLHARHCGMLGDLEPTVLSKASAVVPSAYSSLIWDVTALLLQQGVAARPEVAAALLRAIQETECHPAAVRSEQWQLLQHCLATCPAAAAHTFLCSLLEASTAVLDQQQSWQLYGLLQHCQQYNHWSGVQLKLPTKTVSALIEHQGDTATAPTADTTARILQLWTDFEQSGRSQNGGYVAAAELSAGAQRAVVAAAVAARLHDEAVRFTEKAPTQLPHLISLWEHEQTGQPVPSTALVAALQVAAKLGAAAAAVVQVLQLLWQQKDHADAAKLLPTGLAAQLVEVLSKQDQLHTAQQLLSSSVVSREPAHVAAVSVAKFVSAVAQHAAAGQQLAWVAAAVQWGSEPSRDANKHLQQDLVLETLDQLLRIRDAAAVALLLQVAAATAGNIRGVLEALSDTQLEQLTTMCCANAATAALPTPLDLAQHFADMSTTSCTGLPDAVVAVLGNALATEHPELQPHRAAEPLRLISRVVEASPHGANSKGSNSSSIVGVSGAGCPSRRQDVSWLFAALCSQSIPAETGADTLIDAPAWVQLLTYEAAAAALFACWHLSHGDTLDSINSSSHHSARCLRDTPLPAAAAVVGRLCLQLYQHARHSLHSKPSLDSLLLDLGLAAAADANAWKEGEDIVSAANYIMARSSDISTPSTKQAKAHSAQLQQHWVPLLPAARPALVRVLVHSHGIDQAAQLLLQEHERLLEPHTLTSSRGKGQKGAALTSATTAERVTTRPLLMSTHVVKSFLSASLEVSRQLKQTTVDEEEASAVAAAAVKAAEALLSKQIVAMNLAATMGQASLELPLSAAGANHGSLGADLLSADAETWALFAELCGAAGQYNKLAKLVSAAVQKQLPMRRSTSSTVGAGDSSRVVSAAQARDLQVVLAGAATAWHAAGAESGVFAMLDGMVAAGAMQLTNPRLAAVLLEAANTDDEALASP